MTTTYTHNRFPNTAHRDTTLYELMEEQAVIQYMRV